VTAFAAFPVFLMLQYGRFVLRVYPDSWARIQVLPHLPTAPALGALLDSVQGMGRHPRHGRILAELHVDADTDGGLVTR
jgi:hypothetical protein